MRTPSLRVTLICGTAAALAIGIACMLQDPEIPGAQRIVSDAPVEACEPATSQVDEWVSHLRDGDAEVMFRRKLVSEEGVVEHDLGAIRGTGHLTIPERDEVEAAFVELERKAGALLEKAHADYERVGSAFEQASFAKLLVYKEELAAARESLLRDSYYTQLGYSIVPDVEGTRCLGTSVVRGGETVYVTVVVEVAKHTQLDGALEFLENSEHVVRVVACDEFNALPHDRRIQLVQAYQVASPFERSHNDHLSRYFRKGLQVSENYLLQSL